MGPGKEYCVLSAVATYAFLVAEKTKQPTDLVCMVVVIAVERRLGLLVTDPTFPAMQLQHLLKSSLTDPILSSEILVALR